MKMSRDFVKIVQAGYVLDALLENTGTITL
jgi:hypothetical protein